MCKQITQSVIKDAIRKNIYSAKRCQAIKQHERGNMNVQIEIEQQEERVKHTYETVYNAAHKVVLAGLGLVSLAQEELGDLFEKSGDFTNKLIERGTDVEKDGREMVSKMVKQQRKQVKKTVTKAEGRFGDYSGEILSRFNVPTSSDIEDLSKKVASLSRKVDRLRKAQEEEVVA